MKKRFICVVAIAILATMGSVNARTMTFSVGRVSSNHYRGAIRVEYYQSNTHKLTTSRWVNLGTIPLTIIDIDDDANHFEFIKITARIFSAGAHHSKRVCLNPEYRTKINVTAIQCNPHAGYGHTKIRADCEIKEPVPKTKGSFSDC